VKRELTVARLRELLHYEPATGAFTRQVARGCSGSFKVGEVAGTVNSMGYVVISIDDHPYLAHRLAFLWLDGKWPEHQVDHVNGERADNRRENLRHATPALNAHNRRGPPRNNKSGFLGVFWLKSRSCWTARIRVAGKDRALGHHTTPEAAAAAYLAAKRQLHPGNTL
jgi:hypothetical protein